MQKLSAFSSPVLDGAVFGFGLFKLILLVFHHLITLVHLLPKNGTRNSLSALGSNGKYPSLGVVM